MGPWSDFSRVIWAIHKRQHHNILEPRAARYRPPESTVGTASIRAKGLAEALASKGGLFRFDLSKRSHAPLLVRPAPPPLTSVELTPFSDPVLSRSVAGAVLRCPCCGSVEVHFSGVTATLTRDELTRMQQTVASVVRSRGAVWGWQLRTRTAHQDVTFELWGDDAEELNTLLADAVAVLAIEQAVAEALAASAE